MLKGKTAIVTGGSRGIGAATAKKLASLGANIAIIVSSSIEAAEAVCKECEAQYGVKARAWKANVADFAETKETVAAIKAEFGGVDILINNAGITRDGLIASMKEEAFDAVIDANLKGAFNMIRHCSGIFIRSRYGRIVNVSSVAGIMGNPGQANYSASKAGLIGLTKTVARELASRGITCNAVAPGFVETDMTASLGPQETLAASVPLGRFAKPEEIAEAVAFLVCADYITGEVLRVDGGMAM
jgi:3-oxoacyl-[acyl-carrier protein] reductase